MRHAHRFLHILLISILSAELRRNLDGNPVLSDVSYCDALRMPNALRVKLHIAIYIIRYAYFIISIGKCSLMHNGVIMGHLYA